MIIFETCYTDTYLSGDVYNAGKDKRRKKKNRRIDLITMAVSPLLEDLKGQAEDNIS